MSEFYDRDKFTGGANRGGPPPRRPEPQRGADGKDTFTGGPTRRASPPPRPVPPPSRPERENAWWYSWPAIIILFSLGIWPLALGLLFYNLFWDKKKGKASQNMESAVQRAMRNAEQRFDSAADRTDEVLRRTASQVEETIRHTARQVEQAGRTLPPQTEFQAKPVKPAKPDKKKKAKRKSAGTLLRIIGICCLVIGGIIGLDFMAEAVDGYVNFDNFFAGIGFLAAGGITFTRGMYLNRISRRSQRYILAIGNVDAMPIDIIAKRVNRKPKQAMKELQKLIDKGYMGEDAYIDYERGYFLRFGATLEEEPEFEPEEEPFFEPVSAPEEAEQGYSGILRSIRRANDRIADPELSRKIDRLEQVTGKIFQEVEEHPEKRERIHLFFDYYLPTTQKLLDAYADFEETGVEGEHLRQAKERIEQTMDSIVSGFEHQLDQLYSSDAMDVVSDLKVMEAMLNRDTATVAKDFGFEPPKRQQKDSDPPQGLQI